MDAEDPEVLESVGDKLVVRDVLITELDDNVESVPEEALVEETVEDVITEEADEDELTAELATPGTWAASEFWIALSRFDGIQVVSKLEYP